ncbi:MAG: EAL domain-containing protein [Cardiobacteriaceae bacterium]|nr:EAL domain-containing protein [Cardiobacteriaceae bacterium]
MSDQKENCSILLISTDFEWINAFSKGAQRFYLLEDRQVDSLQAAEAALQEKRPDLIILSTLGNLPPLDGVRGLLQNLNINVPIMVVDNNPQTLDGFIKQGAEYVTPRRDLLNAIKHVQQIMRQVQSERIVHQARQSQAAMEERYRHIFHDLPDAVAYVQDGLFLDANPAFIRIFGLPNREALDDTTLMSFVPTKTDRALKAFLKKASDKEVLPAEKFEFNKLDGSPINLVLSLSQVNINGENALQMFFSSGEGGGSGGGIDETTQLGTAPILASSIHQAQEKAEPEALLGFWVYLLIENYREIWQRDGYRPAELLIKATSESVQRFLPPSTEVVRFTDDALALWIQGDKEGVIKRVNELIARLDETVPEGIGRMIKPRVFAGMYEIRKESTFEDLVSKGYRAVRTLVAGNGVERVAEPLSGNMSRKDEKRVHYLQTAIEEKRIKLRYQPISSLEADGIPRYADRIDIPRKNNDPNEEEVELEVLLQIAERYDLARHLDYLKLNQLFADVLSYDGDQKALRFYLSLSSSALNDLAFPDWIASQLRNTGVAPTQLVIEFSVDAYHNCYTGAMKMVERLRPLGVRFALSDLARYDDDIEGIFKRLSPDVLKLDMREMDTFDDEEEERFMHAIKEYATKNHAQIVVNHMESPAQLSRVWRHNIQLLQGDGIVPASDKMNFNFSEPLF